MSVHVSHSSDAVILRAHPGVGDDCLLQVLSVLSNLVAVGSRLIVDLNEVAMVPTPRVEAFLKHLVDIRDAGGFDLVLVIDRSSGRRLLQSLVSEKSIRVVASNEVAMEPA